MPSDQQFCSYLFIPAMRQNPSGKPLVRPSGVDPSSYPPLFQDLPSRKSYSVAKKAEPDLWKLLVQENPPELEALRTLYAIDYDFSLFEQDEPDEPEASRPEEIPSVPVRPCSFKLLEDGEPVEKRRPP
jgi:hypothetical protein